MKNFTIKTRIWAGFVALFALMGVQAISAWWVLGNTQSQTRTVVEEYQPAVAHVREFKSRLNKAISDLGYYLLTGENEYLERYDATYLAMQASLDELARDDVVVQDDDLNSLQKNIRQMIASLNDLREQIVDIATTTAKRIPAMQYAAENLNPLVNEVLGLTSQMLDSELEEEVTEERRDLLHAIHNTRNSINNLLVNLRGYLAFREEMFLKNARLYQDRIAKDFDKMAGFGDILTFEQEDALERIRNLFKKYSGNFDELVKLHASERGRMDAYIAKTGIAPLVSQVNEKLAVIINEIEEKSASTSHELMTQVETIRGYVLALFLLGLVAGVVIALIISLSITRPLDVAIAAMDDISQGEGDLIHRLEESGNDEIARLGKSFNLFVEKVRGIVVRVAASTEQLGAAAGQLMAATTSTNENVQRQKQEVDQVATAITEMSASAQEVARHSDEAARSAQESTQQARDGHQTLGESIDVIKSLANQLSNASSVIQELNQESLSIGKVLDVINGIAEQTNLLALNAAIEAARAGEQGRGFAVVADEVRTLAAATQQSTLEIQEMITRLQDGTRDAVSVMESSLEMAEQGVGQVTQAGTALDQIVSSITSINMKNTEIAHATDQQRAVAEEVDRNIANISHIAEANSESSHQATEASQALSRLATELKQLVSQFRY